jgi:hypothetical protein
MVKRDGVTLAETAFNVCSWQIVLQNDLAHPSAQD